MSQKTKWKYRRKLRFHHDRIKSIAYKLQALKIKINNQHHPETSLPTPPLTLVMLSILFLCVIPIAYAQDLFLFSGIISWIVGLSGNPKLALYATIIIPFIPLINELIIGFKINKTVSDADISHENISEGTELDPLDDIEPRPFSFSRMALPRRIGWKLFSILPLSSHMVAGLTLFAAMEAEHTSMHAINQYLLIFLVLFTIVTHFLILFASSHLTLLFNTIQSFWQRRKQQRAKDLLYRLTHLLSHHHSSFLTVKTEYDKAYEPYDLEFDSIVRAELDVLSTSQPSPSVNPTTNPLPAPKEIQAPHELTHPAGSPPPSPFKQFNDTWPPTQEANTPINETPLPSTDDMQPVPNSRDDYEL